MIESAKTENITAYLFELLAILYMYTHGQIFYAIILSINLSIFFPHFNGVSHFFLSTLFFVHFLLLLLFIYVWNYVWILRCHCWLAYYYVPPAQQQPPPPSQKYASFSLDSIDALFSSLSPSLFLSSLVFAYSLHSHPFGSLFLMCQCAHCIIFKRSPHSRS